MGSILVVTPLPEEGIGRRGTAGHRVYGPTKSMEYTTKVLTNT